LLIYEQQTYFMNGANLTIFEL